MIEVTWYSTYYLILGLVTHVVICAYIGGKIGVAAANLFIRFMERKERHDNRIR